MTDARLELADQVRRLMRATAFGAADGAATLQQAQAVHALADDLDRHTVGHVPDRYAGAGEGFDPVSLFRHDVVFGAANPVALPLVPGWQPPLAFAEGSFTRVYEGPPDCVHGAVIAASFDQVCNIANIGSGVPGFTVELEIRYLAPTRIERPVRFEARIVEQDERLLITEATARQGDRLTAEATGRFRVFA